MSKYKRSVNAALAMTESRFDFAEALAIDIPKTQGKAGPKAALEAARREIIEAGGEALAISTMALYRKTALHYLVAGATKCEWADASFTAHVRAYQRGIEADDFRANPINEDEIEDRYGNDEGTEVLASFMTLSGDEQESVYLTLRDAYHEKYLAEQREVTPEPTTLGRREPTSEGTMKQSRQEVEELLANLNSLPNRIEALVEEMLEAAERVLPSIAWDSPPPGTEVNRSHGQQALDPLDKSADIVTLGRMRLAKLVDAADEEAKERKARAEARTEA